MGATGIADGAHLHFELEILVDDGSEWVNPMLYLNEVLPEWEEYFARQATEAPPELMSPLLPM